MKRYQLVIGATVAGVVGVLAFPTHSGKLRIPPASVSSASPASAGGPSSTSAGSAAGSGASGSGAPPGERSATSDDVQFAYGDLAVTVTVRGSKIVGVSIASHEEFDRRSELIDTYAFPQLERQVLAADSVNIDGVSGATFTSQAFVDAVANAMQKLGVRS